MDQVKSRHKNQGPRKPLTKDGKVKQKPGKAPKYDEGTATVAFRWPSSWKAFLQQKMGAKLGGSILRGVQKIYQQEYDVWKQSQ